MTDNFIQVEINGQPRQIAANLTVEALLKQIELSTPAVAVEVNLELIPREKHPSTLVQNGDQLEIVSLVGGG